MEFYKDMTTTLRLDELREMLLRLISISATLPKGELTSNVEELSQTIAVLKTSLVGSNEDAQNPTSQEDRIKSKMTELYNLIATELATIKSNQNTISTNLALTATTSQVNEIATTLEEMSTLITAKANQIATELDAVTLNSEQSQTLNATKQNTDSAITLATDVQTKVSATQTTVGEIKDVVTALSGAGLTEEQSQTLAQIDSNLSTLLQRLGTTEDSSTIFGKLASIEQNISSIMQKLNQTNA